MSNRRECERAYACLYSLGGNDKEIDAIERFRGCLAPAWRKQPVSDQAHTLSSKNLSSAGTVNSISHVTSDPDTGGTNLIADEKHTLPQKTL